jgi:hypothetical protein
MRSYRILVSDEGYVNNAVDPSPFNILPLKKALIKFFGTFHPLGLNLPAEFW